jgi:hypothetical protein
MTTRMTSHRESSGRLWPIAFLVVAACNAPSERFTRPGDPLPGDSPTGPAPDDAAIAGEAGSPGPGSAIDAANPPRDSTISLDSVVSIDAPPITPGTPRLGVHGLKYYKLDNSTELTLTTPAMTTQASGSTIIVGVGRGDKTKFDLPTDSKGNIPYVQLGSVETYPSFQDSGTALYAFTSAVGGSGFTVTTTTGKNSTTKQFDEITMAAVEVAQGSHVQFQWNKVAGAPVTSNSVTTTGGATLIAFWWGDGFPHTPQSASPNNDFTVIESNAQDTDSFVQCVVAAKNVSAAGTYNVTWSSMPPQGAQLWLVAVE